MKGKLLLLSLASLFLICWSCNFLETNGPLQEVDAITDRLVIVPDIQYYTNNDSRLKYLTSIVDFINDADNKVSTCIQVGDLTYQNKAEQWRNAEDYFFSKISPNIVSVFCLGNHDYGNNGRSKERRSNIPSSLSPIMDIKAENFEYENYVRFFLIDEMPFAVLVLEFAPRNNALEWANDVIRSNPDVSFIVLTHAFLNNEGKLFDSTDFLCDNEASQKSYYMGGDYINDSKEIFAKIVSNNINVKMVICGHCTSKNYIEHLEVENSFGQHVHCVMVNYQHYKEGGLGYVALLDYVDGLFVLKSYSTFNKKLDHKELRFVIN